MGSFIEISNTLRIGKWQGFPAELDVAKHLERPFPPEKFCGCIYEFNDKDGVRYYQIPPEKVFLVEDIDGKWLFWGQCKILELRHDYIKKTTSGIFQITHLNTPTEMRQAARAIFNSDYLQSS